MEIKEALMEGKKIKGRKRHVATDTQGNLLHVKVHSAEIHDTKMGGEVARQTSKKYPAIKGYCADLGYRGTTKKFVQKKLKLKMDIAKKTKNAGFKVVKKRWVVERFFSWIGNFRRLSKDYELLACVSEQFIIVAAINILLKKMF